MDNWRDLDPDVIAGMFDARLESVLIGSHERMLSPRDGVYELNLLSVDPLVSELDLSEPGIRLLLGRNGSGKSTLLELLGKGVSRFESLLKASWTFSIPSEELLGAWDELVSECANSSGFDSNSWDDLFFLERASDLPLLGFLMDRVSGLEDDGSIGEVLMKCGWSKDIEEPTDGRFPIDDHTFGPRRSFSPRGLAALWVRAALTVGRSYVVDGGAELIVPESRLGPESSNSAYFLDDPIRAESVGLALEQFFNTIDSVELEVSDSGPRFRFLAPVPESGPLLDLIGLRQSVSASGYTWLMFPLDLLEDAYPGRVGSTWFDPRKVSRWVDPDQSHRHVSRQLASFVKTIVVDLRGDVEEQLAEMWSRVVDAHLKVVIVRGMVDVRSDVAYKSSMTGSPPVGREHIIVGRYDRLNEFLSGLSEDLLELDIGVDGLRAFRHHEGGWSTLSSKPGGFFGSLDFGEEMQGRPVVQSSKIHRMSELVLQWQEPISGNWLGMDSASQGQRDVILMLLAMATSSSEASNAKDHLLLIDEFDQHLHPTVSSKFLEIAQRRAKGSGTRAIMSTHSVPVLAHPSTRQAPRIFARRTVDGAFSYSQSPPETREQLAAELGIDLLAASAYSRLFILVEGEHDEAVVQKLLTTGDGGAEITGVEVVNGRGTWAYEGIWNNVLRYHSAPVLVVHDKVDRRFEKAWAGLRERAGRDGEELPRWVDTDFHKMRVEIDERVAAKKSRRGDDESDKMLSMVLGIFGGRNGRPSAKDILRLTFHGIDSPDIIRLLPIDHFLKAKTDHGSWDRAEEWWGSQKKGNPWNKEFKNALKLTADAVRTTLSKSEDGWHPELQRLYDVIRNLHLEGGPA